MLSGTLNPIIPLYRTIHVYWLRSSGSAVYVLPRTRTRFRECVFSTPVWLHGTLFLPTFTTLLIGYQYIQKTTQVYFLIVLTTDSLDMSYSGALQIPCWLIGWLIDVPRIITLEQWAVPRVVWRRSRNPLCRPRAHISHNQDYTTDSGDHVDELLGLCSGTFSSVSTGTLYNNVWLIQRHVAA